MLLPNIKYIDGPTKWELWKPQSMSLHKESLKVNEEKLSLKEKEEPLKKHHPHLLRLQGCTPNNQTL